MARRIEIGGEPHLAVGIHVALPYGAAIAAIFVINWVKDSALDGFAWNNLFGILYNQFGKDWERR